MTRLFFMRYRSFVLIALAALFVVPGSVLAQRDYFTPQEVELIREAQEIDKRIDVLVKAIERRLDASVKGDSRSTDKDIEKWGDISKSTRPELLLDVKRIVQKAIDDIDSLAERPESALIEDPKEKEKKSYAVLFPRAVKNLARAAERFRPILKGLLDANLSKVEEGSVVETIDSCDQIIEAAKKLPAELEKKKPKT